MLEFIEKIWSKHYSICVVVSYWFLGLCNNFAYVIMLSAAHDILDDIDPVKDRLDKNISFLNEVTLNNTTNKYDCNKLSTGTILLADVLPGNLTI